MSPRRSARWSRHVGTKPFSGRRFVERGKVRVEWYRNKVRTARTIGPNTPENRALADSILEEALAEARAAAEGRAPESAMTFAALLEAHLNHARKRQSKRTGLPLSPVTLHNYAKYRDILLRLVDDPSRPAKDIRKGEITLWFDHLTAKGWAGRTQAMLLDHIRQVYRWGQARDHVPGNPAAAVETPSRTALTARAYSEAEIRKLLDAILVPTDGMSNWRFRVMLTLVALYGWREGQARRLEWRDVDFDAGAITLRQDVEGAKRQPTRVVPILKAAKPVLMDAWNRRPDGAPWVIPGWRDASQPVSYDGMNEALHDLERRAKVKTIKGRAWHACRRALLTELTRRLGVPQAAAFVGDTPGVVSGTYLKPGSEDVDEAAAAANQRATASKPRHGKTGGELSA